MRLTCPNCAAQYEVDDRVIPETGRDVQCSNCGFAWFQAPASAAEPEPAPEPEPILEAFPEEDHFVEDEGEPPAPSDAPSAEPDPEEEFYAAEAAEEAAAIEDWIEDEDDLDTAPASPAETESAATADETVDDWSSIPDAEEEQAMLAHLTDAEAQAEAEALAAAAAIAPPPGHQPPAPQPSTGPDSGLRRRNVDEAVLSILREEAERESRARGSASSATFETQEELSFPPAAPARREADWTDAPPEAVERSAPMRGEDPAIEAEIAAAARPHRRELLPDIEEINSTLRATSERGRDGAAMETPESLRQQRSGFRLGFGLSLIITLALLSIYLGAANLSTRFPATAPAVRSYVSMVDSGRIWLDRMAQNTIRKLQSP